MDSLKKLNCLQIWKKKKIYNKNANIQSIMTTVFLICFLTSFIKIYRYNMHDKFLVEGKNNLVYTVAHLDNIEQEKPNRYNIIREYRGEFTFFIDNAVYGNKFVLPKDFTNYIYFVKMNKDNIKCSELLPVPISNLPRDIEKVEIPQTGWNTNPIPSIVDKDKNQATIKLISHYWLS